MKDTDMIASMKDMNMVVCGVGGQGVVFLTNLIGEIMVNLGKEIISSENKGMSQTLGSVSSMIKIGNYNSAGFTEADVVISMEPLEALRYAHLLSDNGMIITSKEAVTTEGYPEDVIDKLKSFNSIIVDVNPILKTKGEITHSRDNMVLLGIFCRRFGVPQKAAESAISHFKDFDDNVAAFRAGFGYEI